MAKSRTKILPLVEGAIMIALATVLSYIRVYKLPWGGSITLLSMLPIALYSIKYGVGKGLAVSFLFSLIQLGQGIIDGLFGWGLTAGMLVGCILFDYILAFTVIGLSGMFRKKGTAGCVTGTVIALLLRFACHFTTGVIIWKSFGELWDGFSTDNTYLYSFLYNGSYMLPEIILTAVGAFVLFKIPIIRKMIAAK
jgi:thiamine transporter